MLQPVYSVVLHVLVTLLCAKCLFAIFYLVAVISMYRPTVVSFSSSNVSGAEMQKMGAKTRESWERQLNLYMQSIKVYRAYTYSIFAYCYHCYYCCLQYVRSKDTYMT